MPRQSRIDIPGLLQHVIFRGVNRSDIFLADEDRQDFVRRLDFLLQETETRCYAWALLGNHVHLLLLPTRRPLAQLMRRLLTGYAVTFNLRHQRSGHLFQNRYKSIVCDQNAYLLELVRYIHLNPIRAGIVDDLDSLAEYRWCGHRQLLGRQEPSLLHSTDEILGLFAERRARARAGYIDFLQDGLQNGKEIRLSRGGRKTSLALNDNLHEDDLFDDRILGGGDFVAATLAATEQPCPGEQALDKLLHTVAIHCQLAPEDLTLPSKQPAIVHAKALLCHIATRLYRIKGVDIGRRLALSPSAVSKAALRGRAIYAKEQQLQKQLTVDTSTMLH
ncbi:transposase [Geothermobacter hydrogeniphilus]|uniref:Transposase IS200-like domain-containing protein n=1 Tax=Geothermobacter hydrogeniphilus TaxID=1969733 RepID=A0A1X0YBF8_9BACT|nr:transposase [Geothermobacter hydrogeniphilus]ORJ62515.1 hypothetical protein B5V00_04320 [Geothermobacter hydrogeniphilus]